MDREPLGQPNDPSRSTPSDATAGTAARRRTAFAIATGIVLGLIIIVLLGEFPWEPPPKPPPQSLDVSKYPLCEVLRRTLAAARLTHGCARDDWGEYKEPCEATFERKPKCTAHLQATVRCLTTAQPKDWSCDRDGSLTFTAACTAAASFTRCLNE